MSAWERLDRLFETYDGDAEFGVGSGCMWSGQVRLTLTDPDGPSRSIAFYSTGGMDPEHVAETLLEDVEEWLKETDTQPLPVPEWKN